MIFFYSSLIFITGFLFLGFGFLVYTRNRRSLGNKTYAVLSLSFAVWVMSWFAMLLTKNNTGVAIFFAKLLNFGALWIPILYLHWVFATLSLVSKKKMALIIGYLITCFFALFSFSGLYISGVHPVLFFDYWPTPGPLYFFFIIFGYASLVGTGLFYLVSNLPKVESNKKNQIIYMLLGSLAGFGGGAVNFIFMYSFDDFTNLSVLYTGAVLLAISPLIFAYAAVRYRFMNVRTLLSKSILYVLLIVVVSSVFTLTAFFVGETLQASGRYSRFLVFMCVSLVVVIGIDPLKKLLAKISDDIFFKDKINYPAVLRTVSTIIAREIDLEKLLSELRNALQTSLKIKAIDILVKTDSEFKSFAIAGKSMPDNAGLVAYLRATKDIIITDELYQRTFDMAEGEEKHKRQEVVDELERQGVEFCVPVYLEAELQALLILGQKQSGDIYGKEEIEFFSNLASQVAVAIEKAQLYQSISEFNLDLQNKISAAKKELESRNMELREANDHLQMLDKAKSEFLSIASHQLRTPISAIKGYLSMMLEGDFGKVPDNQRKIIDNLFESASRLARLINIFLNVSRIESGRFKLDKILVNPDTLVTSVMQELGNQAKLKGLKLTFKPSKNEIQYYMDSDKIREVILNLIDNAIKYTPKGSIAVETSIEGKQYHFKSVDTGVGIRPEEVKSLFQKFVRATGISQVNTQGSGLGLYIAQRVIAEHGGKIWAESDGLEKGSRFHFIIPLVSTPPPPEPVKPGAAPTPSPTSVASAIVAPPTETLPTLPPPPVTAAPVVATKATAAVPAPVKKAPVVKSVPPAKKEMKPKKK